MQYMYIENPQSLCCLHSTVCVHATCLLFVYKDPNQSFSRTAASLASSRSYCTMGFHQNSELVLCILSCISSEAHMHNRITCISLLASSLVSAICRPFSASIEAPCSRSLVFKFVISSSSPVSDAIRCDSCGECVHDCVDLCARACLQSATGFTPLGSRCHEGNQHRRRRIIGGRKSEQTRPRTYSRAS